MNMMKHTSIVFGTPIVEYSVKCQQSIDHFITQWLVPGVLVLLEAQVFLLFVYCVFANAHNTVVSLSLLFPFVSRLFASYVAGSSVKSSLWSPPTEPFVNNISNMLSLYYPGVLLWFITQVSRSPSHHLFVPLLMMQICYALLPYANQLKSLWTCHRCSQQTSTAVNSAPSTDAGSRLPLHSDDNRGDPPPYYVSEAPFVSKSQLRKRRKAERRRTQHIHTQTARPSWFIRVRQLVRKVLPLRYVWRVVGAFFFLITCLAHLNKEMRSSSVAGVGLCSVMSCFCFVLFAWELSDMCHSVRSHLHQVNDQQSLKVKQSSSKRSSAWKRKSHISDASVASLYCLMLCVMLLLVSWRAQ